MGSYSFIIPQVFTYDINSWNISSISGSLPGHLDWQHYNAWIWPPLTSQWPSMLSRSLWSGCSVAHLIAFVPKFYSPRPLTQPHTVQMTFWKTLQRKQKPVAILSLSCTVLFSFFWLRIICKITLCSGAVFLKGSLKDQIFLIANKH